MSTQPSTYEVNGTKILIYKSTSRPTTQVGRGPLGQKVARNPFSLHSSGEHLLCGLFVRHIGTLSPKKVAKQKTCPIPRKRLICDYLLLNYITGKKCKISCSTITKTTSIIRKSTKNLI